MTLTEEDETAIQEVWDRNCEASDGEEGFLAALEQSLLTRESFLYFLRTSHLALRMMDEMGGEYYAEEADGKYTTVLRFAKA